MPKINQEEYEVLKGLDNRWKWIARDDENQMYSAELYVFERKPEQEDGYWNNISNGKCTRLEERDDPFQFIQWEDEEPYEIAELIREYEIKELRLAPSGTVIVDSFDKSEETEVKKDKKWAKGVIRKELEAWRNTEGGIDEDGIKYVLNIIDQLDEPEVLSQDWIDDKTFVATGSDGDDYAVVGHASLKNLIIPKQEITEEQVMNWLDKNDFYDHITAETVLERAVDKGELIYYGTKYSVIEAPTIPKYVAEFLELVRSDVSLMLILEVASTRRERSKWEKEYDWISENDEVFARAWLDGYEVEEEPLYYALIKGHELLDGVAKYWAHNKYDLEDLFISYETRDDNPIVVKNTKKHWNDLSINESNADFVRVDEELN